MVLRGGEAMYNKEYVTMTWSQKLVHKIKAFFVGLFSGLIAILKFIPLMIAGIFIAIWKKMIFLGRTFMEGDSKTRFSYLVAGFSNFARGQIIKGLLYLFIEIGFIYFMITSGAATVIGLITLGTQKEHILIKEGQIPKLVPGDNSQLMLLFGVLAVIIIIAFVIIYFMNISSAINAQRTIEKGKKLPGFIEELKDYRDSRFHITLLTLPIIGICALTILPIIFMFLMAFTNFDSYHQPPGNLFHWVGLTTFKTIFAASGVIGQTFWPILGWTVIWAVLSTSSCYLLGMLLAIIINKKGIRFKGFFRTVFVLSIAIPQFASLLIMRNMFDDSGPINSLLLHLGVIHSYIPFLSTDPTLARITILLVNLWIGIPYTLLITTGILLNIPADLYEAAKIDGASSIAMFRKITLPYILFVTTPYLITAFIGNINNFNVIFLLSAGGPTSLNYYQAGKTDLLVTWLYKLTLNTNDFCYASAIGIIVFIISMIIALSAYRNTAAYKNEEAFQ
jgi:arabinogalactan oligomer / maltooligosaccharide transport system permease protein